MANNYFSPASKQGDYLLKEHICFDKEFLVHNMSYSYN